MTRVVDKVLTGLARAGFASAEQRWRFKSIRSSPFIFFVFGEVGRCEHADSKPPRQRSNAHKFMSLSNESGVKSNL